MNKPLAIAALSACFLAGCGGDAPSTAETGPEVDPVVKRMHDKEYVKKLEKQVDARREIMREMEAARKALATAEAEGKPGEELAALSNALKVACQKIEKNRAESIVLVSQQMQKERAANVEKLQQKGK